MTISVVILTKNEEKNIKNCIKSVDWANEIIVIDDYSMDQTVELARKYGAKVYQNNLDNDFAKQRNFGLEKAKNDWVLFIDADEYVSDKLKNEILGILKSEIRGFLFKRKDKFLGQWLDFGETSAVKFLRLAKKGSGLWQGKVHETWQIKGQTAVLKHPLLHKREISIGEFLQRIDSYSSIRADELFEKKIKTNIFLIILYPLAKFFQNYFLRIGFLDGLPGFVMSYMMSVHSFLVRAKLYLLWRKK